MAKILIIGAGVAGLTAGIALKKEGHEVNIYEAAPIPGGRAFSTVVGGNAFDWGAEAIEATTDSAAWLFADIHPEIGPQPVDPDFNEGSFILPFAANGVVSPLPAQQVQPNGQTTTVEANIDEVTAHFDTTPNDDYFGNVDMRLGHVGPDDVTFRQHQFANWQVISDAVEVNPPWGSIHNSVYSAQQNAHAEHGNYEIDQTLGYRVVKWAVDSGITQNVVVNVPVTKIENTDDKKVKVTPRHGDPEIYDAVLVTVPTDRVRANGEQVAGNDLLIADLDQAEAQPFRQNPLGCYLKMAMAGFENVTRPAAGRKVTVTFETGYSNFIVTQNPTSKQVYMHAFGDTARVMSADHQLAAEALLGAVNRLNNQSNTYHPPAHVTAYVLDWCDDAYIGGAYSTTRPGHWQTRQALREFVHGRIFYAGEAASSRWFGQVAGAMETGNLAAANIHTAVTAQ
ncbi:MAG: FAD-dependent oxidoreductase [Rhodospirillales bacterium]|nr:FAD-dependent oxidoreductase [Rhodospirillales bacterium]